MTDDEFRTIELTAHIVAAHVSNNLTPAEELPALIRSVHEALGALSAPAEQPAQRLEPAVPIRRSITTDAIICLEDGRRFKSLKRHLRSAYNLTPDQYRAKWGLPKDYPMVAPAYSEARATLAKQMGLGQGGRGRPKAAPATKPSVAA